LQIPQPSQSTVYYNGSTGNHAHHSCVGKSQEVIL
jgi:hypothetical protein